jgi:hypothetical protein
MEQILMGGIALAVVLVVKRKVAFTFAWPRTRGPG